MVDIKEVSSLTSEHTSNIKPPIENVALFRQVPPRAGQEGNCRGVATTLSCEGLLSVPGRVEIQPRYTLPDDLQHGNPLCCMLDDHFVECSDGEVLPYNLMANRSVRWLCPLEPCRRFMAAW